MEPTPLVTGNSNFDHWLAILGAFVPLASAVTSFINHRVRSHVEAGAAAPRGLLAIGSALNFASVNVDKGLQLMRMLKGQAPTPAADPAVVDPTTAAPAPAPAACPTCGRPL